MLPSCFETPRLIPWNPRVPNFMCQGKHSHYYRQMQYLTDLVGGDFLKGDGTGSFSIYGDKFPVSVDHSAHVKLKEVLFLLGRKFSRKTHRTGSPIDGKFRSRIVSIYSQLITFRLIRALTPTDVK